MNAKLEEGMTQKTNPNAIESGRSQRRTPKQTPNTRTKLKLESTAQSRRILSKEVKAPMTDAHNKTVSMQTSPESTFQRRENQGICLDVHVVPGAKRTSNGSKKIAQVMEPR